VVAERDTGWIQLFCESNQEVLDSIIMLYRLCEMPDIMLPAMAIMDAFILSHTSEPVQIPGQHRVDEFLPPYSPETPLRPESPMLFGSVAKSDQYMEFRYTINVAMKTAAKRIVEVEEEYHKKLGRSYHGLVEEYKCSDADAILIANGSVVSTSRHVVNEMREEGKKVGLAKLRVFRPFPAIEIVKAIGRSTAVGVLDRSYSFGHGGALFQEIRGASYGKSGMPGIKDYVAGIGGRDVTPEVIRSIYDDLLARKDGDPEIAWVDLNDEPMIKNMDGGD
jgi:pyruvate/2-oxoacid:ferredoxin oxidoreductase alpha subunit